MAMDLTKLFTYYKQLGDRAMAQVSDADLHRTLVSDGNSIAIVAQHMAGNMRSRFTDFLTSDGEKPWRDRDGEFVDAERDRTALLADWENGWSCLLSAIAPLTEQDMSRVVYIRNEGHTVEEALHRQLAHYAYHVGQIVLLARSFAGDAWTSLSIPRNGSAAFNKDKFAQAPERKHFTEGTTS
jgi:hypothetical protein